MVSHTISRQKSDSYEQLVCAVHFLKYFTQGVIEHQYVQDPL